MQEFTSQASRELYRARSLSISPLTALSIADVRREEREKRENERRKRIVEQETYCMPVVAISPPLSTDKLVACILNDEPYVEKIASSNYHTIDLIHEAVEDLKATPTLIEISTLRYIALGKLQNRFRYYYHGILVPFRPVERQCSFDVRVYGMRV
jgi:ribosome-interacting GTPase 1